MTGNGYQYLIQICHLICDIFLPVPRRVLKDQYQGPLQLDEKEEESHTDDDVDFDNYDAGNEYIRESAASPPAPNIEGVAKDNFTKDLNEVDVKSPPHKSNGLSFGKFLSSTCLIVMCYLHNIIFNHDFTSSTTYFDLKLASQNHYEHHGCVTDSISFISSWK